MNVCFKNSRNEKNMKQDATAMREEKIRRMRVEKECENRLKEIALMEVIGLIGFVNL